MPEAEISDSDDLLEVIGRLRADFQQGGKLTLSWKCESGMTSAQRASIHVIFEQMARELNDAGLDMRRVLRQEVDIPWSKKTVKEFLYKPLLEAMTLKTSTEDMSTVEPDKVYKVLCRLMAEKHGYTCPPFPSRFNDG